MVAKALTRKGTALVKMAKCSKDYEPAIETFQKALTEHRNPDTLKKLNDAEKAKKDLEQQEYFDPTIADEEREKGNIFSSYLGVTLIVLHINMISGPYNATLKYNLLCELLTDNMFHQATNFLSSKSIPKQLSSTQNH